jgi:uncharacterized membrane protein HdeD (DUF308 family)
MSSGAAYGSPDEDVRGAAVPAAVLGFTVSRGVLLFFGAVSLVLGLLVMFWPEATIGVVAVLFGVHLLLHGAYRILQSFVVRDVTGGGRVLLALFGLFSIIIGVLCLRNLLQTVAVLALLLGLFWLIGGIIEVIHALSDSAADRRGLDLLSGGLGAIAGIVVLAWPEITLVALAVVLGIWLVISGVIAIVVGLRVHEA